MAATVNVNGQITDERRAVVSVFDHGFLYGEGVYETLRTYDQQPFLIDRHLDRLRTSARMIDLPVPLDDREITRRIDDTMRAAAAKAPQQLEWYIRILLTRGTGELTYDPAACPTPSLIIIVKPQVDPAAEVFEKGVRVALVSILRNHPASVNPLIKSNNLLNNALAMQEAFRRGAYEAVMRNYRGELAECTQSNLFVVKDQIALTPPLDAGLLAGITREFLFEVGNDEGIVVREATLHDQDLYDADEAFLTSTTREVVPIVQVDDRTIGRKEPGPVTKRLLGRFRLKARALTQTATARRS